MITLLVAHEKVSSTQTPKLTAAATPATLANNLAQTLSGFYQLELLLPILGGRGCYKKGSALTRGLADHVALSSPVASEANLAC